MPSYTLTCLNDSKLSDSLAVFQKPLPSTIPDNVFSLAWFALPTGSNTTSSVSFNPELGLNAAEPAMLKPAIQKFADVTSNLTSVGIGMAGSGTFTGQTPPNMTAPFIPYPKYWAIFGNFETGNIMEISETADKKP